MADRLGDEDAASRRRIDLEEFRLGRGQPKLVGPVGIAHPRLAAPAAEAIVEVLPANLPVAEVVAALGRAPCRPAGHARRRSRHVDLRVEARLGTAREIGVKPEPARHRIGAAVAAAEANRETALVEGEFLGRVIVPGPFAGFVAKAQGRAGQIMPLDRPGAQPTLPVKRTRVSGHVRLESHRAPRKVKQPPQIRFT